MTPVQRRFLKIIEIYGTEAPGADARWFRALLRDLLSGNPREINALADSAVDQIPIALANSANDPYLNMRKAQLQVRLQQERGWEPDLAKWTVETWAAAVHSSNVEGRSISIRCPACRTPLLIRGSQIGRLVDCTGKACGVTLRIFAEGKGVAVESTSNSKSSHHVIVAHDGSGQYSTLAAAVAEVPPDTQLEVRGGPFLECVTITKPVTIMGAMGQRPVVLQNNKGPCFVVRGGELRLAAFSLEQISTAGFARKPVMEVLEGHVVVEKCQLQSQLGNAVNIHGSKASAQFSHCTFFSARGDGVVVWDHAHATFSECRIKEIHGIGISLDTEARVKLLGCRIEQAKYLGVKSRKSALHIEDCTIDEIRQNGVEISGGTLQMSRSTITRSGGRGLRISGGATGVVQDCDLSGNRAGGRAVTPDCTIEFLGQIID